MKRSLLMCVAVAALFTPTLVLADTAPPEHGALSQLFVEKVAPVLFTGLATLLGWVFVQLAQYFGVKKQGSKAAAVAERLFHLAQTVVADLEVTLKPQLLEATADGVLTAAEINTLRGLALTRLKALAGERGLKEAQALLGIAAPMLDQYLNGVIEHAVDRLPSSTAASKAVASVP